MPYAPYVGPPPSYNPSQVSGYFGGDGWVGDNLNPFSQGAGGRDVYNQFQGIGQNQFKRSQDWDQQFGGLADYYQGIGGQYGQTVGDLYNPIWQGGGGYTPEMQNNILQSQGLQDVQGDLQNNYLTGDEQRGIMGSPYAGKDFFAGQAASLSANANDFGTDIRNQASAGDARGQGALSEMRAGYGGALDQLQQGYQSAIDPSKLRMSEGYMPQMDQTLSGARSDIQGAMSDPGLNLTGEYRQQAGMSDQEVADTASAAARGVGAQFQATKDQLDQDAAASGTATPLGLAAARTALDRSSAASQSDALTNARLQARAQQRQAAQGVQSTALQAGQYRAGLGSSNALALEGNNLGARQGAEGMRLGAEQGLSGMQMGAATGLADRRLEASSNLGKEALGQAQYITNAGMGASAQAGNWNLNTGQYNASMGTGLEQQGEANASQRAGQLSGNRQSVNQYNQGVNLGVNSATSGRYQQAYQPWVSAQQEGRAAAQGQQQYYGGQANQQNQFRGSGWQTGLGGQLGSAQGYSGWGSTGGQGFGDYLGKAVAAGMGQAIGGANGSYSSTGGFSGGFGGHKAHGGLIDQNQLIEVGEGDRPEVILPLDPKTPPEHRNMWERMGSDLGEHLGIKGYAEGGIPGYAEGGIAGDNPYDPGSASWNSFNATSAAGPNNGPQQGGWGSPGTFNAQGYHGSAMPAQQTPQAGGLGMAPPQAGGAGMGSSSGGAGMSAPSYQPSSGGAGQYFQPQENPNLDYGQNSMLAHLPQQPQPNPNANYGQNSMLAHLPEQQAMPQQMMPSRQMPMYRPQFNAGAPQGRMQQPSGDTFGRANMPPMAWNSQGGMGGGAPQPNTYRMQQNGSPYPGQGTRSNNYAPSPWGQSSGYTSQQPVPSAYGQPRNYGNGFGNASPQSYNRGAAPSSAWGGVPRQTSQQQPSMGYMPQQGMRRTQGGWGGSGGFGGVQPQGFARGGMTGMPRHLGPLKHHPLSGGYRMNIGRHNSPMPVPLSEMGSIGNPAYV